MKLCLYNSYQAGVVVDDQVYHIGDALVRAAYLKRDYTMVDVIEKITNYQSVLGPWIVTRDEIDDPQDLNIRVEKNGELVMNAHTKDMICNVRDHIRFLSSIVTLRPGDLITTGTPAGVKKLEDGDKMKGSIDKIGEMSFSVKAEK
jgi:2-keto-4-pentenoate hydratase/2-oxohepta-3-ene-1,7-dioic acid hydratase in catechol pathway